jgi:hypothetical protein
LAHIFLIRHILQGWEPVAFDADTKARYDRFRSWFGFNGGETHRVGLSSFCNRWYQVGRGSACITGVVATEPIEPGQVLMRVPMMLVLSEANLGHEGGLRVRLPGLIIVHMSIYGNNH